MSQDKIEKFIVAIVIVLLVLYAIYRINNDRLEKKKVLRHYGWVEGRPILYETIGSFQNCYITYEYKVAHKTYSRNINIPNRFKNCDVDFSICSNKRFWIAYEKGDPSNSLINIDIEIQGIENPIPPETLDGFR